MIRDHEFIPHPDDPTRCGRQMPTTARYPKPASRPCWGRIEDHPTPDEAARLRRAFPPRPEGGAA